MNQKPLSLSDPISFVIPGFNCASTILESIESIIDGNWTEGDELIIVNDGSTDNTENVLAEAKKKYPFIKVFNEKENRGCPAARNIGYTHASHEIIFNLYSDDVLVPGSVAKLKEYMISENADIAGFEEYRYFKEEKNGKKKITHRWMCRPGVLSLPDFLAGDINPGPGGNFMFIKQIWKDVGGVWEYGKGMHEAWGFTLKCLMAGAKFVVMPKSFYFHRYGSNSLFVREAEKENEVSLMATKMITPYLDRLEPSDKAYIQSEEGSKNWYSSLDRAPIRLKGEPFGKTGVIVVATDARLKTLVLRKIKIAYPIYRRAKALLSRTKSYVRFIKQFKSFQKSNSRFVMSWKEHRAFLRDADKNFSFDRHYVYHPAWAARVLKETSPQEHVDISSTVHFCSIVSAFIPVKFYDYRKTDIRLSGLSCGEADLLKLPFESNSLQSLSCMHTIEHIGLGRYGDPIDPDGDLKAVAELTRVLAKGGTLLFVVPIGKPKIIFNAHRIYSYDQILTAFKTLTLKEFSLIPEKQSAGGIIKNATKERADQEDYGCGCFWFTKS
ncbi:MAG: glycosyltransferase [Patescibacteria group bacterium]